MGWLTGYTLLYRTMIRLPSSPLKQLLIDSIVAIEDNSYVNLCFSINANKKHRTERRECADNAACGLGTRSDYC